MGRFPKSVATVSGDSGGSIRPTASNINIQGTGNIAVSGEGSSDLMVYEMFARALVGF